MDKYFMKNKCFHNSTLNFFIFVNKENPLKNISAKIHFSLSCEYTFGPKFQTIT